MPAMLIVIRNVVCGFFIVCAIGMLFKAPKFSLQSNQSLGYYLGVAIVGGIGVGGYLLTVLFGKWLAKKQGEISYNPPDFGQFGRTAPSSPSRSSTDTPAPGSNLGPVVSAHMPASQAGSRVIWLVVGAISLCIGGALLTVMVRHAFRGNPPPPELYLFPAAPILFGLACIGLHFLKRKQEILAVFHGGIAIESSSGTDYIPWSDIQELTVPPGWREGVWTIERASGQKIRFGVNVINIDGFYQNFQEYGLRAMVRHKLEEIAAGQVVKLGRFEIHADAIKVGKTVIHCSEVKSMIFQINPRRWQKHLRIDRHDAYFTWTSHNLWGTPSEWVLTEVIQRVAPAHLWSKSAASIL
jgi:hypothetical protein